MTTYKTAESVCAGHPDKLCDLIADGVLDACLRKDRNARVACEVMATRGRIVVAGEITCTARVNIRSLVGNILRFAGYEPRQFHIQVCIHQQSGDIAAGVDKALEAREGEADKYSALGAGDQGTMCGYATDETRELLPLPLFLAHQIVKRVDTARRLGLIQGILPDGKAQVTVEYEDGKPRRVKTIVVSVQHVKEKSQEDLRWNVISQALFPAFETFPFDKDTEILVNPSGRFVEGGPAADTGLTGRKLMVDTYGGLAPHGGGAFSGKDATKVDRSGAYMARYIAKNIVWAGLARECLVSVSYAIGKADPVAFEVNTFGTGVTADGILREIALEVFDLRPAAIIERFNLREPVFSETASYGHFGGFTRPWEAVDQSINLREAVNGLADRETADSQSAAV